MARKKIAVYEHQGTQFRYVLTQPAGEYDVTVKSFEADDTVTDAFKWLTAIYQVEQDGKLIPGAVFQWTRKPNGLYVGDTRVKGGFAEAASLAVEQAATRPPRRSRRKTANA